MATEHTTTDRLDPRCTVCLVAGCDEVTAPFNWRCPRHHDEWEEARKASVARYLEARWAQHNHLT